MKRSRNFDNNMCEAWECRRTCKTVFVKVKNIKRHLVFTANAINRSKRIACFIEIKHYF